LRLTATLRFGAAFLFTVVLRVAFFFVAIT
jgi:hypothetical protein